MGHVETLLSITTHYVTSCDIKLYQKLCPYYNSIIKSSYLLSFLLTMAHVDVDHLSLVWFQKKWCFHFSFLLFHIQILNLNIGKKNHLFSQLVVFGKFFLIHNFGHYFLFYKKRNDMFIIFLQQILSDKLLLVVIVRAKKVILVLCSNLNQ